MTMFNILRNILRSFCIGIFSTGIAVLTLQLRYEETNQFDMKTQSITNNE